MNKGRYNTNATLFDGYELIFYCYNKNDVTFEELFLVQEKGYKNAIEKQHKLFISKKAIISDIEILISFN